MAYHQRSDHESLIGPVLVGQGLPGLAHRRALQAPQAASSAKPPIEKPRAAIMASIVGMYTAIMTTYAIYQDNQRN